MSIIKVMIRGGGDLGSGIAYRLYKLGITPLITEIEEPRTIRRTVSFAESVFDGKALVEGVEAVLISSIAEIKNILDQDQIPVLIDRDLNSIEEVNPDILIDARMIKKSPDCSPDLASLVIGLGPGFQAGKNCDAAIETKRGHTLGRVIWKGTPQLNTGIPGAIVGETLRRVLRSPNNGELTSPLEIGDSVSAGSIIAHVDGNPIRTEISGVLRGLIKPGIHVKNGEKIADIDPRNESEHCFQISEKALAIAGGVIEAIFTIPRFRYSIWNHRDAE